MVFPTYTHTTLDADVDHLIKLHLDYPQATLDTDTDTDTDTDKLWIILRQSVAQHGIIKCIRHKD